MAATTAGGTSPPEVFPSLTGTPHANPSKPGDPYPISYANVLKPKAPIPTGPVVPIKPVIMLHGKPNITWKSSEVRSLIVKENLQYAIVGKFLYGKSGITELRKQIPGQCGIKSECTIGVLDTRHVLICLSNFEDYVHLLSTTTFHVKAKDRYWQMCMLKWDTWFEPEVETKIGVAWISFLDLPPNFFAKEAIFSIAAAIGKPLTVDMAIRNQTRPSCAKVKVEVDLTAKMSQRVRIIEEDDVTEESKFKWIKVQYDHC